MCTEETASEIKVVVYIHTFSRIAYCSRSTITDDEDDDDDDDDVNRSVFFCI